MTKAFIAHSLDEVNDCPRCSDVVTNYWGAHPCDEDGNKVAPSEDFNNLVLCGLCGRIINSKTKEVVGRKYDNKDDDSVAEF